MGDPRMYDAVPWNERPVIASSSPGETERLWRDHLDAMNDLSDWAHRYRATISGCGCCGSPFLDFGKGGDSYEEIDVDYGRCT